MTLTSWIKYDHEIQKILIDANVITQQKKFLNKNLIYVNLMLI